MNGMTDFEKELSKDIREMRDDQKEARRDMEKNQREIRRNIDKNQKETSRDLNKINTKLAVQKAKSGLLGATGGAGVVGLSQLWEYIKAYIENGKG